MAVWYAAASHRALWLSCERTHDSGFMVAKWCRREACYVECRVLLVRVNSCDERVQGVSFGVVGGYAQRELALGSVGRGCGRPVVDSPHDKFDMAVPPQVMHGLVSGPLDSLKHECRCLIRQGTCYATVSSSANDSDYVRVKMMPHPLYFRVMMTLLTPIHSSSDTWLRDPEVPSNISGLSVASATFRYGTTLYTSEREYV
jgi:hypothetical protein